MAVWLARAGKQGQDENMALENGLAIIGWREMPDISNITSFEEMKKKQSEFYPNMSSKANMNNTTHYG